MFDPLSFRCVRVSNIGKHGEAEADWTRRVQRPLINDCVELVLPSEPQVRSQDA